MSARGKYKTLTLEHKMKVLSKIDAGYSVQDILNEFGISKSTFYDIKKDRKKFPILF